MNYFKIGVAFFFAYCLTLPGWAQRANEITVSSTIVDAGGTPLAGAVVTGNEGKTITYTDRSGHFSMIVLANSTVLINAKGFRGLSFRATAVPQSISLTRDNQAGEVNVAFRRVDRRDLLGAISVLNPENYIDQDYNLTIQGGMNGRVAGLLGSDNIWGLEDAIVMIDGIRRDFNDITLNEVQQITVLKGVNAVPLYGSQAAKGVILITTKRGEPNNRKIGLRVNTGVALPRALPKYLNAPEYMTLYNEARRNDGLADLYDAATIENHRTGNAYRYPSVDYYSDDYLKKYQHATDANVEFAGGNNVARFYSNIGWSNSSSLLKVGEGKNEGDNRLNVRGNVDIKLNDFISSSVNVLAVFSNSRRGRGNYWGNAATLLPHRVTSLIPTNLITAGATSSQDLVKSSRNVIDGSYILGGSQQFLTNPLADLYVGGYDKFISRTFQVTNGIDFDLSRVLRGLSFHTLFNLDYWNSYTQSIANSYAVYLPTWNAMDSITGLQKFNNDSRPGTENISNTAQRQNLGFSAWADYRRVVNDAHHISAMLLGYASSITVNNVYQPTANAHLGLQLGYNFKRRYYADFTGAYVNSTRLPAGKRAAFSPTASIGWLISAEDFLSSSETVNHLKLSASAGILNTDLDINGYYLYDNIYTPQAFFTWNDGVQAQNRATMSSYGASPDLSFPQRKEISATVEGRFFKDLLTFQSSVFSIRMDGLPTQRFSQYPNYFSSFIPYTNYNAYSRSGFDVMLNLNKQIGDLTLSIGTNATFTKSNVTKRDELYLDAYQNRADKPVDAIFGLVSDGFFMDQQDITNSPRQVFSEVRPGDIKYVDQNGDNVIDQRDEVMIGRWVNPFNYGVNISLTFKNFNLFVLGTGSNGGYGMRTNDYFWVDGDNKYSEIVLDRWTESTKNTATFPRLSSAQNNNNFRSSDFWLFKADRFNLSKVQLNYSFGQNLLRKSFVRELGAFLAGANLYTFSKNRSIMDLNIGTAPQFRHVSIGVRGRF